MKNGRSRFIFELKTLIHELILVKQFSHKPTEMTMKPSQWENILCNTNRDDNSVYLKK